MGKDAAAYGTICASDALRRLLLVVPSCLCPLHPHSTAADAINPLIILILVPIMGAYISNIHPFKMVLYGTQRTPRRLCAICSRTRRSKFTHGVIRMNTQARLCPLLRDSSL